MRSWLRLTVNQFLGLPICTDHAMSDVMKDQPFITDITRAHVEAAVQLKNDLRSDYDLNPRAKRELQARRPLRPAAVLCGLVMRDGEYHVILTQRPTTMREHPGQVAFPGGKIDRTDNSAVDAALREASEEIGLPRGAVDVIGSIDAYETGTGFRVEPIVAVVDEGFVPVPDPYEVEATFEPPLSFLINPANLQLKKGTWGGAERQYYAIPWQNRFIWGATAGMLKCLGDRLAAVR